MTRMGTSEAATLAALMTVPGAEELEDDAAAMR